MTLTPFDVSVIRNQIASDLDPEGAADRLADLLGLPADARELMAEAIREAANAGYCEGYNDGEDRKRNRVLTDGECC